MKIKKIKLIMETFFLSLLITSCSTKDFSGRSSDDTLFTCIIDKYSPGFVERHQNKENLKKLKIGMIKEEVFKIMGEPLMYEPYAEPNVWFYYTEWDWADCAKTRVECDPVVFEKGKLIGWGRVFYKKYSHQDWLYNSDSIYNENPTEGY